MIQHVCASERYYLNHCVNQLENATTHQIPVSSTVDTKSLTAAYE